MAEESFLLVSLEEEKAKKLAQVLSNDTSRKILDFLSRKDGFTETEVAKEMKLPLSTVHYNLQQLVSSNLVTADEFHYSQKGKEVLHYSLSNKYVIIAPKATDKLKEKLRMFLPVFLVIGVTSAIIQFISTMPRDFTARDAAVPMIQSAKIAATTGIAASNPPFAMWFLFGSVFAMLLYMVWSWVLGKKK